MRARMVKIGNSQGIRIPKPLLEQTGIMEGVELDVEKNQIIIRKGHYCHYMPGHIWHTPVR